VSLEFILGRSELPLDAGATCGKEVWERYAALPSVIACDSGHSWIPVKILETLESRSTKLAPGVLDAILVTTVLYAGLQSRFHSTMEAVLKHLQDRGTPFVLRGSDLGWWIRAMILRDRSEQLVALRRLTGFIITEEIADTAVYRALPGRVLSLWKSEPAIATRLEAAKVSDLHIEYPYTEDVMEGAEAPDFSACLGSQAPMRVFETTLKRKRA
jgi:hypothetical protein